MVACHSRFAASADDNSLVAVGAGGDLEAGASCWAEAANDRRLAKAVMLRSLVARARAELEHFIGSSYEWFSGSYR